MNFRQIFIQLGDLSSTFANIPCGRETSVNCHQLSELLRDHLSISVNILYGREISVNFRQTFVQLETFRQLSLLPREFQSTSVNISCGQETFRQIPSDFCVAGRPSDNFHQISIWPGDLSSTFCTPGRLSMSFRQLAVRSRDLSTSINFPCGRGLSVIFCQLSVQAKDLPSTSINIPCSRETFCQLLSTSCTIFR